MLRRCKLALARVMYLLRIAMQHLPPMHFYEERRFHQSTAHAVLHLAVVTGVTLYNDISFLCSEVNLALDSWKKDSIHQ